MDLPALPPALADIQAQAAAYQARAAQMAPQRAAWRNQTRAVQASLPRVWSQANGDFCGLGELSPGCRICHAGRWDCLFLTDRCNLACPFCYSPPPGTLPVSASPAEIIAGYQAMPVEGISFSGGEPFINPAKLLEWAASFTRALPGVYFWVYTNGTLVEETHLAELGRLGVSEIRFDAAATGYNAPELLRKLALAARHLSTVSIEIPAIPEDGPRLLAALPAWAAAGVRYLNLHELIFEPHTPSERLPGPREEVLFPDGHHCAIHPHSRDLTHQVMREVERLGLVLNVNDCSTAGKILQVEGRRRLGARRLCARHENVTSGGLLETLALWDGQQLFFIHPDEQGPARAAFPAARAFRLRRLGPLAAAEAPLWTEFDELNGPEDAAAR